MFWRTRQATVPNPEVPAASEDPDSDLSRQWDREHDRVCVSAGMALIEGEFRPATWQAFRRLALDNAEPEMVAAEAADRQRRLHRQVARVARAGGIRWAAVRGSSPKAGRRSASVGRRCPRKPVTQRGGCKWRCTGRCRRW